MILNELILGAVLIAGQPALYPIMSYIIDSVKDIWDADIDYYLTRAGI